MWISTCGRSYVRKEDRQHYVIGKEVCISNDNDDEAALTSVKTGLFVVTIAVVLATAIHRVRKASN